MNTYYNYKKNAQVSEQIHFLTTVMLYNIKHINEDTEVMS